MHTRGLVIRAATRIDPNISLTSPEIFTGAGGEKCDFWPYRSTALDFVPLWFGKEQDIVTILNCLCSNDLTMSPPSLVQIFPRLLKIIPGSFGAPPITDEKSVVNRQ